MSPLGEQHTILSLQHVTVTYCCIVTPVCKKLLGNQTLPFTIYEQQDTIIIKTFWEAVSLQGSKLELTGHQCDQNSSAGNWIFWVYWTPMGGFCFVSSTRQIKQLLQFFRTASLRKFCMLGVLATSQVDPYNHKYFRSTTYLLQEL